MAKRERYTMERWRARERLRVTRADRQSREAGKACWQLPEGEGEGEGEALEKERRAVQISKGRREDCAG